MEIECPVPLRQFYTQFSLFKVEQEQKNRAGVEPATFSAIDPYSGSLFPSQTTNHLLHCSGHLVSGLWPEARGAAYRNGGPMCLQGHHPMLPHRLNEYSVHIPVAT